MSEIDYAVPKFIIGRRQFNPGPHNLPGPAGCIIIRVRLLTPRESGG